MTERRPCDEPAMPWWCYLVIMGLVVFLAWLLTK